MEGGVCAATAASAAIEKQWTAVAGLGAIITEEKHSQGSRSGSIMPYPGPEVGAGKLTTNSLVRSFLIVERTRLTDDESVENLLLARRKRVASGSLSFEICNAQQSIHVPHCHCVI